VVALGAAFVSSALSPTKAEADVPRVLRPGTRPMQFLFGFGPGWGIGGASYYTDPSHYGCRGVPGCHYGAFGYYGAFKLTQEFSGHFRGNASGLALGVLLNQSFGYRYFDFVIAPKFTNDIQLRRDLGLYISPNVSFGYELLSRRFISDTGDLGIDDHRSNYHAANLQFGVGLKLMLDDLWIVWLQFPHFDMTIGPAYTDNGCFGPCPRYFIARLNLLAGAGVSF
jgi:hypothetical protein